MLEALCPLRGANKCCQILVGNGHGAARHAEGAPHLLQEVVSKQDHSQMALLMALRAVPPLARKLMAAWLLEGGEPHTNLQAMGPKANLEEPDGSNGEDVCKKDRCPKVL